MKKYILLLVAAILYVSCECQFCGHTRCICGDNNQTARLTYNNDYFCADKLLGTWQMDYGCIVGNIELKQIKFFDGRYCDITMVQRYDTDWYTETWTYSYYGNTIKFARNDGRTMFSFNVKGYIFPELYLRDSFGTYTWRKVRSNGC